MSKSRPKQQNFSVAQKYEEVWTILDSIDNKSEFICQAIVEKFNKKDDEHSPTQENIEENKLKDLIKETLNEMIKEDLFIIKGNINSIGNISMNSIEKEEIIQEEVIEEKLSDELKESVRNIIGNW